MLSYEKRDVVHEHKRRVPFNRPHDCIALFLVLLHRKSLYCATRLANDQSIVSFAILERAVTMMGMFGGFSASKLKPGTEIGAPTSMVLPEPRLTLQHSLTLTQELKMAISRIQISSNKKAALLKQNMREIAVMLSEDPPKEEKAKIRAEALIRDDNLIEAYEILQLECELLFERIKLIEFSKLCPSDLVPPVSDLIYASQRVDIPELMMIRKQFRAKYGKEFEKAALENYGGVLNQRIVTKLSVDPPAAYLVQTYLERICEQFEVDWKPKVPLSASQMAEPMAVPVGYSVAIGKGTGLGPAEAPTSSDTISSDALPPPIPSAAADEEEIDIPVVPDTKADTKSDDFAEVDIYIAPKVGSQPPPPEDDDDKKADGNSGGMTSSYADLAARFDQLKK